MLHVLQAECIKRIIRRELGLCYKCFPVLLHYWSFAGNGIITQFRGKHFHHRTLVKSNLCCSKASVAVRVNQAPSQKHREVLAFICSLAKNKDFTKLQNIEYCDLASHKRHVDHLCMSYTTTENAKSEDTNITDNNNSLKGFTYSRSDAWWEVM